MYKAKWCRLCKKMKRDMAILKNKHGDDVTFGGVDANDNNGTVRNQRVTSLPTFVFYKAGEEVFRITGNKRKELDEMMAQHK